MRLMTLALMAAAGLAQAEPFVFQGSLNDAGAPAEGLYDFTFILYDAEIGGSQFGPILNSDDLSVENGSFLADLDFGNDAFDGTQRWIEIRVRQGDTNGEYTLLSPRAEVGSAPQANYAIKAGVADELSDQFWTMAPGILQIGEDQSTDKVLINRSSAIESTDMLTVHSPMNGPGGMTMSTWGTGMPYFGYAAGGLARARTYYDPFTDAWVVSKGGQDVIEVDQNNDVVITNNLIVNGTITSANGTSDTLTGYKAITPNAIFRDFEFLRGYHPFAGAIQLQGSTGYLRADFDLPHGAQITNIRIDFVDQAANTNLRFQLHQRMLDDIQQYDVEVLYTSTGSTPMVTQRMDLIQDPPIVIDNTMYTYSLRAYSTSGSWPLAGTLGIWSFLIEYELPLP